MRYGATATHLSEFVLGLLQHALLLLQSGLRTLQTLALWLDDAVDASVDVHRPHPHAEGARGQRDAPDDVRLEVGLRAVLADLLQHTVADVVLVEVHQLLDEILVTCRTAQKQLLMLFRITGNIIICVCLAASHWITYSVTNTKFNFQLWNNNIRKTICNTDRTTNINDMYLYC